MPTNKKFRGTKRTFKPKGNTGVPNAVKKYVKKVTARTRPEMKQIQNNFVESTALVTNTAATSFRWLEWCEPTQGTTRDTRVANEIYLHGMHSKGAFHNNGSVPVFIRRLVLGAGPSTVTGASAELFDNGLGPGVSITTTGATMALITNKINKAQFKVYYDKTIKVGSVSSVDGMQTKIFNYFQKFGGKKILFEGATAGLNNQSYRISEVYLVASSDNDAAAATIEHTENNTVYFTDP